MARSVAVSGLQGIKGGDGADLVFAEKREVERQCGWLGVGGNDDQLCDSPVQRLRALVGSFPILSE